MTQQDDFLRKAAVLIGTLDDQAAESLLDQIGRDQAARLRSMLGEIRPIAPQERAQVVQEFLQAGQGACPLPDADGVEVDDSLAAHFAADDTLPPGAEDLDGLAEPHAAAPLTFLRGVPPEALSQLLAGEHPQTIGVVLSQLSADVAAEILRRLPPDQQGEVLRRMGHSNFAEDTVLAEIEQELQRLFHRRVSMQEMPPGLAAIRAILQAADSPERRSLLAALERSDPVLWRQIAGTCAEQTERLPTASFLPAGAPPQGEMPQSCRADVAAVPRRRSARPPAAAAATSPAAPHQPRAIEFHDLAALNDLGLAELFRRSEPQVALLALTGAPPALVERIRRQLPWREARDLKRQMEHLGPLRLSDVELAQQQLARLAGRLIDEGTLAAPSDRRFTVAA